MRISLFTRHVYTTYLHNIHVSNPSQDPKPQKTPIYHAKSRVPKSPQRSSQRQFPNPNAPPSQTPTLECNLNPSSHPSLRPQRPIRILLRIPLHPLPPQTLQLQRRIRRSERLIRGRRGRRTRRLRIRPEILVRTRRDRSGRIQARARYIRRLNDLRRRDDAVQARARPLGCGEWGTEVAQAAGCRGGGQEGGEEGEVGEVDC